jgi:methyl-accepting chemotaxis protein
MTADVGRGMEEIATSIGALAAGAEQQVAELESQRASAGDAAAAIERTRDLSAAGLDAVQRASTAMASLDASSHTITEAIHRLAQRTAEIDDFVGAVTRIADQTNLLALNAAIEAARAGDAGRGFAVVAEEVRKLADETQQATRTISDLVQQVQAETTSTVTVIEQTAAAAAEGVDVVGQAREAFETITEAVGESIDLVAGISASAESVAAVAVRSSESTASVSAATEQTSASMQEMAAAAADLAGTAEQLRTMTARFRLTPGDVPTGSSLPQTIVHHIADRRGEH